MKDRPLASWFVAAVLQSVMISLLALDAAGAMTLREGTESLLGKLGRPEAPGQTLFAENFEGGTLERWRADKGWSITDRPDKPGKCAQVVSSEEEHEDLILKERIPIVPGHPIAAFWRVRYLSGGSPLFLRVDFFGEDGKQGQPYARQEQSQEGQEWTDNALLVSDWFPAYTRSITLHFHHSPKAATTSLLDDVRIVDLADASAALVVQELSRYTELADRLAVDVGALPKSPLTQDWKRVITARLNQMRADLAACSKLEAGSSGFQNALEKPAVYLRRFTEAVAGLKQGAVTTTRLLIYRTKPISSTMVLPRTSDLPGQVAKDVTLVACPGENEPVSLVLWAPEAMSSVSLSVTDLRGARGVIPSTNVDVKSVKCWFQAGSAPHGIGQDRSHKSLVSELLLNDDSLVKVDLENQRNYLKLSFPEGPKYVPVDDPTPPATAWGHRYKLEEFPVHDSSKLLPLDLPAGENKQVWITVKVPPSAKPGRYAGSITVSAAGKRRGQVTLTMEVLPFVLDPPKTHYDLEEDFTYSLYYWGELDPEGVGGIGYKYKSEEQFRAELRMMYDHGIVAPAMIWSPSVIYQNQPLFRRHLTLAREVGMSGRPLYFADSGLIGNPTEAAALEALKRNVSQTIRIAREYGFPEVYFYGIDEATEDRLRSQRPAWNAVHEAGGKVIVSGYEGQLEAVGDLLDLFNRAGNPAAERPAEWHNRGHKVWNYGNPQTPVEDPEVYRRNYGLHLWKLDFDGACTYCFMDSSGTQWNDFDDNTYRDHNVAYPTVDGVVGTLALEGFREGVDDVRYATTLRQQIEKVVKTGTPEVRDKASKALAWLEDLKLQQADLDEVRRSLIRYILELRG